MTNRPLALNWQCLSSAFSLVLCAESGIGLNLLNSGAMKIGNTTIISKFIDNNAEIVSFNRYTGNAIREAQP